MGRFRFLLAVAFALAASAVVTAEAQNGLRREVWDRNAPDVINASPNAQPPPGSAMPNPFVEAAVLTDIVPNIPYADWPGGVAPIPDDNVYAAFTGNITPTATGNHASSSTTTGSTRARPRPPR